jgi:hypothetical protein
MTRRAPDIIFDMARRGKTLLVMSNSLSSRTSCVFEGGCELANTISTSTLENEHMRLIFKGSCSLSPPPPALGRHHLHLRKREDVLIFEDGCPLPTPPLPPSKMRAYAHFRVLPTTPLPPSPSKTSTYACF